MSYLEKIQESLCVHPRVITYLEYMFEHLDKETCETKYIYRLLLHLKEKTITSQAYLSAVPLTKFEMLRKIFTYEVTIADLICASWHHGLSDACVILFTVAAAVVGKFVDDLVMFNCEHVDILNGHWKFIHKRMKINLRYFNRMEKQILDLMNFEIVKVLQISLDEASPSTLVFTIPEAASPTGNPRVIHG